MLSFFIGNVSEVDFDLCRQILDEKLQRHPNGAFFLFFKGRLHFVLVSLSIIFGSQKFYHLNSKHPKSKHLILWTLIRAGTVDQIQRNQ